MEFKKENTEILSVKILNGVALGVATTDGDDALNIPLQYTREPHKDFVNAMAKLEPVLKESYGLLDKTVVTVTGYKVVNSGEDGDTIVISGKITTASGPVKGISSEKIPVNENYYDSIHLDEILEEINEEAQLYLFERKSAYLQVEPDFKEEDEEIETEDDSDVEKEYVETTEEIVQDEEENENNEAPIPNEEEILGEDVVGAVDPKKCMPLAISEEDRAKELEVNDIKEEKSDEELANEMIALRKEAKELKIKSSHLFGRDKLIEAIADKKAEQKTEDKIEEQSKPSPPEPEKKINLF